MADRIPINQKGRPCVVLTGSGIDWKARSWSSADFLGCDLLEWRLDLAGRQDIDIPLRLSGLPPLLTCRRKIDGGAFEGTESERLDVLRTWISVLPPGSWVDVEWGTEAERLQEEFPSVPFLLSRHVWGETGVDSLSLFREMKTRSAQAYKLVVPAEDWSSVVAIRRALQEAEREGIPLACFGMGRQGLASRLLSAVWGSSLIYVSAGRPLVAGMPDLTTFRDLFRGERFHSGQAIYGVVGNPVGHSLSPLLHNAFFSRQDLGSTYVLLPAPDWEEFVKALPQLGLAGISVTAPHKALAFQLSRVQDSLSCASGTVNTLVADGDGWKGFNTDGDGFLQAIRGHMGRLPRSVLLLGAGGAARALARVLAEEGIPCHVWSRKGVDVAPDGKTEPWIRTGEGETLPCAELLVCCIPSQAGSWWEEAGISLERTGATHLMDLSYAPVPTPTVRKAIQLGMKAQDGFPMLYYQALEQNRIWTGRPCPFSLEEAIHLAVPWRKEET